MPIAPTRERRTASERAPVDGSASGFGTDQHQPPASAADAGTRSFNGRSRNPIPRRFRRPSRRDPSRPTTSIEGAVVKGTVVAIEKDLAVIDVGLKTEGRVAAQGIRRARPRRPSSRSATRSRSISSASRTRSAKRCCRARRPAAKRAGSSSKRCFDKNEKVNGVIFNQVKGGFTVDLDGAVAFLPRSQVDIRPVRDVGPLMHTPQPFQILKMDKRRGNIVVSRRAVLEETRAEQRSELVQSLEEGQVVDGVVKNITDYGAFVDLGGIDGLLHVTDIAWRRVNHPTEVLSIGETVKVQIIRINHETHRISPRHEAARGRSVGGHRGQVSGRRQVQGPRHQHHRLRRLRRAGAGHRRPDPRLRNVAGPRRTSTPARSSPPRQEVEVMVLEVDPEKRRISLGLKQTLANPWEAFAEKHPVGSIVEGEVKNKTEFGLFIGLDGDVDGMVHLSDLDWNRPGEEAIEDYNRGDMVKAAGARRRRREGAHLARHQAARRRSDRRGRGAARSARARSSPARSSRSRTAASRCKIADTDLTAFIRRADLSRDRVEQRPERFAKGEKVDARVTNFDKKARKVAVSIKALEIAEEKEAVAQYGSSDSGASLGDILGAALKAREDGGEEDERQGRRPRPPSARTLDMTARAIPARAVFVFV